MDYREMYLEGRNKVRWAIASTLEEHLGRGGIPFADAMFLAGGVMDGVVEELKRVEEHPDYQPFWSRSVREGGDGRGSFSKMSISKKSLGFKTQTE